MMGFTRGTSFPSGGIDPGHVFFNKSTGRTYVFKGVSPSSTESNWVELDTSGHFAKPYQTASDPSTVGWGSNERGYCWYNTTDQQLKMWDGSAIVLVG